MEKIKEYLGYAYAAIVSILAAAIYFLIKRNNTLNSKVGQLEAEKQLANVLEKKEEAHDDAIAKELEYQRVRDSYLSGSSDSDVGGDQTP